MSKERSIESLSLSGGALCFHFVNTVSEWRGVSRHEYLGSYQDLLQWCRKVDILTERKRRALQEYAGKNSAAAEKALQRMWKVRETLYHFFSAIASGDAGGMEPAVTERFNRALSEALQHLRFNIRQGRVVSGWDDETPDLLLPLWIVMKSAYDVLTTAEHDRIKECMVCGWLFLDHSKNNKRRWCSPLTCGSIEKSRRYYQKRRAQG